MRQAVRAFLLLSPLTAINLVVTLAQFKILAVLIGPTGTGLYSLALAFVGLASTIMGFGLSASLPKLVAELRETNPSQVWPSLFIGIATSTALGVAFIGTIVATDLWLARALLGGDTTSRSTFAFVSAIGLVGAIPWTWALTLQGFLKGLRNIRTFVVSGAAFTVVAFLSTTIGALTANSHGAIAGALLGQTAGVAIFAVAAVRESGAQGIGIPPLSTLAAHFGVLQRRLVYLGVGAVAALVAASAGQSSVRSYLTHSLGLTAVGLFAASWALSNRLTSLIYGTFSTYTIPTISALHRDWSAVTREQNHALRLGLLVGTPALCATLLLIPWLIPALLSAQFLPGEQLFRLMLVGEMLSIVYWATSLAFYPTGRAGLHAVSEWGWWLAFGVGLVPLVRLFGLEGAGYAYIAAYLFSTAAVFAFEYIHHRLTWIPANVTLVVMSLAATVAISNLGADERVPFALQAALSATVLFMWAVICLSVVERRAALSAGAEVTRRFRKKSRAYER